MDYDISVAIHRSPGEVFAVLADVQDYLLTRHDLVATARPVPCSRRSSASRSASSRAGPWAVTGSSER